MKLHKVDQGTSEWFAMRLGIPTTSNFYKIITPKTGKPSSQAREYMYQLIAERLLNEEMEDKYHIEHVERGKIREPDAAAQLSFKLEVELEPGGFITTDDGRMGCSPDRLITGRNEMCEIKCPQPWTQIGYLLDGPGDQYRPQVQGQLLIGEFDRVHFYSWHPQMPPFHRPTTRDEKYIATLHDILASFLDELDFQTERARKLGSYAAAVRESPKSLHPMWAI